MFFYILTQGVTTKQKYSQDSISNSPYCLPYNLCDVNLENLDLNQPIIPLLIFSLFSLLFCLILY